jgi:dTDP-4-amino-4,6-dideoxygalactose transaminase
MTIPLVDLRAQYESIKDEVDVAIYRVVRSGQFILGPEVRAFEEEMAAYCGTKYAVGVASGTDALHLALLACGIRPGDEVITTPFTFIATAECIAKCGAKPVFVDIDSRTYNIDPEKIEQLLESKILPKSESESRPKITALLPVHLYGQPANMDRILEIAAKYGLKIIEDCAQALGATYAGSQSQSHRKVGSFGDVGCLSFFPSKALGAYGDGGMVVTNDSQIAETARILRVHGSKASYQHVMHGFNSRLDALQAAILRIKLQHLDRWIELRRDKAALYTRLLSPIAGIEPPYVEMGCKPSCNYYTVRLKNSRLDRSELRRHLESKGIQTMVYYPVSLHLQEVYKPLGYKLSDFPESERAQEQVLTLPMYPELSEKQIEEVVAEIRRFVNR